MVPGEERIEVERLVRDPVEVEPELLARGDPVVQVELLRPGVEALATAPGALDEARGLAPHAREHGLDERGGGIVAVHADRAVAHALEQQLLPALHVLVIELRAPLEGRVRLGDEDGDRDGDGEAAAPRLGHDLAAEFEHVVGEVRYGHHVVIGLSGQTHHEVELHAVPSLEVGGAGGAVEVLLGHVLVDDVAHALASGFGREGQTALLLARHLERHVDAEGVEALGGDAHRDARVLQAAVEATQDGATAGVVGGGERGQADLVVTRGGEPARDGGDDLVGRTLAHRAVRDARLAEPAAARAAAEHLHGEAVVHELGERHHGLGERVGAAEVLHHALVHHGGNVLARARDGVAARGAGPLVAEPVQGRHVDAAQTRQAPQDLKATGPGVAQAAVLPADLGDRFLALTDQEGVEEDRERLGVEDARTAADDDRVPFPAFVGM